MTTVEVCERRYLAGLIFEDATTGAPVRQALELTSPDATFFQTAGGVYVVRSARGLAEHLDAFEQPPNTPGVGDIKVVITVRERTGLYLPRLLTLALPRSPDPTAANSVVRPVRVPLYRSLGAQASSNWATLDARLVDVATGRAVRNAVVEVVPDAGGAALGKGVVMTGSPRTQGQLALSIVGLPVVVWGTTADSVLVPGVSVLLRVSSTPSAQEIFDPDVLTDAVETIVGPFQIASGRRANLGTLQVAVPV